MKIMPTLDGGLRIDAEDKDDWRLLSGITGDTMSREDKLSHRLGELITDQEVALDWLEYIVPELEDGFTSAVLHVTTAIASARVESGGGPGPLWITREEIFQWYSALNQARLAIEDSHHFGPGELIDPEELPAARRSPFLRSQFYCAIQSMLLTQGMG
jgi:hypothetical protein